MQEGVDGEGGQLPGPSGDKRDEPAAPPADDAEPEHVTLGSMIFGGAHLGKNGSTKPRGLRGVRRSTPPEMMSFPVGKDLLTTAEAARYCSFRTLGGLRKAWYDLLVFPAGRRGGRRSLMWNRQELDRFLRGEPLKKSDAAGLMMPPKLKADEAEP